MKRVAVFGATDQTGRLICQLLLEEGSYEVIACARTVEKLAQLETSLAGQGLPLTTRRIDLHNSADVDAVIEQVDLIVGATSQWQDSVVLASRAATASTHYCGTYLSNPEKWQQLRELDTNCRDHGVMVVDDCGTHPGLPAAMIRWMLLRTPLHSAWVGGKFALAWNRLELVYDTVTDFLDEIASTDPSLYIENEWKRGFRHTHQFKFPKTARAETCMPMMMEEIRELALSGSLASTGFFIAGFGFMVDYVLIPVSMLLTRINRKASANLFGWGLQQFASRPGYAVLQLDAEIGPAGRTVQMVVSHDDPYFITAAPVVETIRQILARPKPGVWTQGGFVEPNAFFDSLLQQGIHMDVQIQQHKGD